MTIICLGNFTLISIVINKKVVSIKKRIEFGAIW